MFTHTQTRAHHRMRWEDYYEQYARKDLKDGDRRLFQAKTSKILG
jgi:hypothetical protein